MNSQGQDKNNYSLLEKVIQDFEKAEHAAHDAQQKALESIQLQRETLFPIVESKWAKTCKMITFVSRFGLEGCEIGERDVVAFQSMLGSIGTVTNLVLMINSPGGSAETSEKILDMCRRHCSGTFRVIVPNKAKSAATLIAFGSDTIVMGDCSELGPIDPQIIITVGNVPHQLSALSFIQSRDELIAK